MKKIFFQINLIIFGNLFAFLTIGHILDAIFKTGALWKLVFLGLSLPVLGLIMYIKILPLIRELHDISETHGK